MKAMVTAQSPCGPEARGQIKLDLAVAGVSAIGTLFFDGTGHPRWAEFSEHLMKASLQDANDRLDLCAQSTARRTVLVATPYPY